MKRIFLSLLACVILSSPVLSQNNQPSESQKLTQQVYLLYQQGKFEEAISSAEKIVEIEKKSQHRDFQNLATAKINLALLQKEYYWILKNDEPQKKFTEEENIKRKEKRIAYSYSVENLLKEVIEIHKTKLKAESLQLALAQIELAKFLDRFGEESIDVLFKSEIKSLGLWSQTSNDKLVSDCNETTKPVLPAC